ncbi:hypothetical protein K450DRAFT_184948 [Umbelopsis ramanniana AG]|uniref:Ankyrin repeat protein n=1 Tax=Umbelopsis ramanniana AG TaxID=1314678 RepID=A0AAD5EFQ5_UMBRA|nr:uncharacterized protein K450DRAFT_184948 [Umbelopsis ramanniana AG]KAI8582101.1 hypothetical protein K450DRAFT_184948 [Umbelopsis ramanniana AG]
MAARQKKNEIVKMLLKHGATNAKIGATTKHGDTALHLAAESNYSTIVTTLIKYGANVNAKNEDGKTPIQIALLKGYDEIVTQLKNSREPLEDFEDDAP